MKRFPTLFLLSALIPTMASAAEAEIQTGYFIDSPVSGLYYQTSSDLSGRTNKGSFQYRTGDVVSFFLGNDENSYLLSTVSAQEVITPTLISTKPSRSINITRLLLSLDSTPENRQEILLLDSQLSDEQFQAKLKTLDLNHLLEEDMERLGLRELASADEAVQHLNESQQFIQANFQSDKVIFEPRHRRLSNVVIKKRDVYGRICAYDLRLKNHPKYHPPIGELSYELTESSIIEYPSKGDYFYNCQIQPNSIKEVTTTALEDFPDDFGTFQCAEDGCTRNDLNGFTIDNYDDEGDWKYRSIAINFDPTTQLLMEKSQGMGSQPQINHPNRGEEIWFTYPEEKRALLSYQGVWRQTNYLENTIQENCLLISNGHIKQASLVDGQCPADSNLYTQDVTRQYSDMWWVNTDSNTAAIEQLNIVVRWYQPQPTYTTWEYLPAGSQWDKGILYRYQQTLSKAPDGSDVLKTYAISEYVKVKENI